MGWFLDLKTVGKIVASHSACAASGQGVCAQQGVELSRNISILNAGKYFASLTGGRNQCDRAVWTGWKKWLNYM